jgi:hypothetical protein
MQPGMAVASCRTGEVLFLKQSALAVTEDGLAGWQLHLLRLLLRWQQVLVTYDCLAACDTCTDLLYNRRPFWRRPPIHMWGLT